MAGYSPVLSAPARLLATLLVAVLLLGLASPAGAEPSPPNRVDPPAPGEGKPLADPTEPEDASFSALATPTATFQRSVTTTWPALTLEERRWGADRVASSVALSRAAFPNGRAWAVVTPGNAWGADALAVASAGANRAPLLMTAQDRLSPATRDELRRLGAKQVLAFGVSRAVQDDLARLGVTVSRFTTGDLAARSFGAAQQAVRNSRVDRRTVVVLNANAPLEGISGPALAAAARYPLLLTPPSGGNAVLRQQLATLGATEVIAVGSPDTLPDAALTNLGVSVRRVGVRGASATAAAVAGELRRIGLRAAPAVTSGAMVDVMLASGFTGAVRQGAVLPTGAAELPGSIMSFLARDRGSRVTVYGSNTAVGLVARCQLRTGQARGLRCVEEELRRQGYNTGAVDGRIDHQTVWAFYAFEKVARTKVDGVFGEAEWKAMLKRPTIAPRRRDLPSDHVEIDLSRQLILLFRGGKLAHAFHTSTGKPSTPTIRGTFSVYEKRSWYQPHNGIYKGIFFYGGYAIHGYKDIPLYPASAGCARTYNGDQDFLWPKIRMGERVAVY